MYARVLYVGQAPCGEASFGFRLQETLRLLGHAVQACPDPAEESCGKRALESMVAAFKPTLILWDTTTVSPASFARELKAAPCLAAGLVGEGPDRTALPFDAVLCLGGSAQPSNGLSASRLDPAPDTRYRIATISDPTVEREGVLVFGPCTDESLDAVRSAATCAGITRVIRADDALACPGACAAYEFRTYAYALWLAEADTSNSGEASSTLPFEVAMRKAEGLIALVERPLSQPACLAFDRSGLSDVFQRLEGERQSADDARRQADAPAERPQPLELQLPFLLERLDAVASEQGKPLVLSCTSRARLVMAYGWFGAHNYGDDLLLRLVVDRLVGHYDNAQVFAVGADAHVLRSEFGLASAAPHEKGEIARVMPWASALVYCGGLIFDQPMAQTAGELEFCLDPWIEPSGQAAIALLAATYGVRPVMLGIGAGPMKLASTRRMANLLGRAGTRFLTRDEQTSALLRASGVDVASVTTMADLVLGSSSYVERHAGSLPAACEGHTIFTVSLRWWPDNPADLANRVARVVDRVCERTGLAALFLPFDADDVQIHREVVALMEHPERAILLEERPDEPELLACIKASRFACAMRLHCSVLHNVLGKPAAGLSYNDKVEAFFRAMGEEGSLFGLEFDSERLAGKLVAFSGAVPAEGRSSGCGDDDHRALKARVGGLSEVVDREFDELFAIIDAAGDRVPVGDIVFYPRNLDRHEVAERELGARCEELERRCRELAARTEAAEAEARDLRASTSFRLGNALVRPLAGLRHRSR